MENTQTLGSLKAGEQVAVEYRGKYEIHTISKITPSGQIVLEDSRRFKNGREMGDLNGFYHAYLYAVTPAILDKIKRRKVRSQIDTLLDRRVLDNLSNERLGDLLAVLKKGES